MMCGSGFVRGGKVLLLALLLLSVSSLAFTQGDVGTTPTVELIDEALALLEEQARRLDEREASLTQRATNLNQIEQSLLRIETVASDFEQYSKSLEDENKSLEFWNNILIGVAAAAVTTTGLVLWLR